MTIVLATITTYVAEHATIRIGNIVESNNLRRSTRSGRTT
jgi:hypothetical protein